MNIKDLLTDTTPLPASMLAASAPATPRAKTTSRTDIDALTAEFAAQPPDVQSDAHRVLARDTAPDHLDDYDVRSTLAVYGTWQTDFDALASALRAVAGWVVPA